MPEPRTFQSSLTSTRSTSIPARRSSMVRTGPGVPPPMTSALFPAMPTPLLGGLLDGDRVDGGADGSGDGQGRGGEPELVHAVGGAVVREGVGVPYLADQQAHVGDDDLVQRLEGAVELVRPYLEAPGVGGDGGDLARVQPAGGGEGQAGRVAARIVAPALAAGARQLPGPDDDDVPAADGHAMRLGRRGQVFLGD